MRFQCAVSEQTSDAIKQPLACKAPAMPPTSTPPDTSRITTGQTAGGTAGAVFHLLGTPAQH